MNSVLRHYECEKLIDTFSTSTVEALTGEKHAKLDGYLFGYNNCIYKFDFIYKSSFMNENPFSRISNPLSLGITRRGDIRVINFLVHPRFRKYILLHLTEKKNPVSLLLLLNSYRPLHVRGVITQFVDGLYKIKTP